MAKTKSAAKKAQDLDRYLLLKEEYINNSELTDLSGEIADAILNLPVRVFMTDATHAAKQRGANHYFLMDVHAVERKARIYRSKLGSNLKTIAEFYRNTARTAELLHRAAQMVVDNYDESGEIFDPTVSNLLGFINSMIHNYEMTSDKVVTDE